MTLSARVDATIDAAMGHRLVGCVVLVHRGDDLVFSRAAGFADREAGTPTAMDTIFRLASMTKPIVAAAALRMVDLGLLKLDDAVADYLPWFAPRLHDSTSEPILIRHLLTHTSGLAYDDVPENVSTGSDPGPPISLEENLKRLARVPLAFTPGSAWQYGMSIDVLGAALAQINGTPSDVEAVLAKYVTGPLGMVDTHFYVADPARLAHPYGNGDREPFRMAEPQPIEEADGKVKVYSPARIFQEGKPQCGGSAAAGTAGDFLKLLVALRGDFLKPETRDAAFANQIGTLPRSRDPGQKFGFLGAVIDDPALSGWQTLGMIHWGGVWGSNWILDPASGTSVVVFTNTMPEGCNGPFREEIRDAVFG